MASASRPRPCAEGRAFRLTWRIALVAFHALLLFQRLADATILHPAVLARWGVALALLLGAAVFQRLAPARLRRPRAVVVFWILAFLLHLVAPFDEAATGSKFELTMILAVPALAVAALLTVSPRAMLTASRFLAISVAVLRHSSARGPVALRGPPALQATLFPL